MPRQSPSSLSSRRSFLGVSRSSLDPTQSSRNRTSDGACRQTNTGARRSHTNAENRCPHVSTNPPRTSTANSTASSHGSQAVNRGSGVRRSSTFDPISFHEFQSPESPFKPARLTFPPLTSVTAPAVWSWQMGEDQWVPFDAQVSGLLETLWDEMQQQEQQQQDEPPEPAAGLGAMQLQQQHHQLYNSFCSGRLSSQQPLRHAVYVQILPWEYCIDLQKMLQQNTCTRKVRPIRRSFGTAALWFVKGEDGYAQRFDPEVEFHLEELYRLSLVGDAPPNSLAIAWQEPHSGSVHTTDVAGLVDTTDGNPNSAKQVVRMEIKAAAPAAAAAEAEGPTSANADATADVALPSLVVGREETGEAFCTGLSSSVDCQAALLSVAAGATPEDACAICLESLLPENPNAGCPDSSEGQRQSFSSRDSQEDKSFRAPSPDNEQEEEGTAFNSNGGSSNDVVRLKECSHHFHRQCIKLYARSSSKGGFVCPTCNVLQLPGSGPSPPGKMRWTIIKRSMLSGHPTEGTIIINYEMEGGVQTDRHAQPHTPFTGTRRTAYLPDCLKARQLLRLLIHAFIKGHMFTVGTSVTSGRSNVVIWNGIHHKTSVTGGVLHYGYPDETFLTRLSQELSSRGFRLESEEATE